MDNRPSQRYTSSYHAMGGVLFIPYFPFNGCARLHGMSYSQFMGKVSAHNIALNRKVLADLAMNHPDAFKAVVDKVK